MSENGFRMNDLGERDRRIASAPPAWRGAASRAVWPENLSPTPWTCPQCSAEILTRDAGARCPVCGYREEE